MDHKNFQKQVRKIYKAVEELEKMFPKRPFTPDGHMVGSIGETLVADAYDLKLLRPSNEGFDAVTKDGKKVEIKATQSDRVAFRSCPEYAIVIKIDKNGRFEVCYNGLGKYIWKTFEGRKMPKTKQFSIGISVLKRLDKKNIEHERIPESLNYISPLKK